MVRKHFASVVNEDAQQIVLGGCKLHLCSCHAYQSPCQINFQLTTDEDSFLVGSCHMAHGNPQPRHQLPHAKWLSQIIISPSIQGCYFLALLVTYRENQNRNLAPFSYGAHHVNAIHIWQPQIEDDKIGTVNRNGIQRYSPAFRFKDLIVIGAQRYIKKAPDCPLVIDTSGIWFRPEGDRFICGFAPPAHLNGDEPPLDVEHEAFDDLVWPALAARVPAFEAVRMRGAWAGYYEMNTFDHNAVLGRHPDCDNLYFAAGFSGHGLQQAPAVGRGLAELIREGRYVSLDLSDLGFERILEGRPLLERNVI